MYTIVLTGGGTAGHCAPNLALLPYLKPTFDKIYYIGSEHGIEKKMAINSGIEFYSVPCEKLRRNLSLKNLLIPTKVIHGVIEAGRLLDKLKPDVIFSKGGYVALPTVIAAKKRKIPVILHESDYSIGLANKISCRYSKCILTSFPETSKIIKKGKYVGSPIRLSKPTFEKDKIYKYFGFNKDKPVVLILGGSSGANAINQIVFDCIDDLVKKYNVLHVCGKNKLPKTKIPQGYYPTEFIVEIQNAYEIANVCVSRAGSNSLFELLNKKIPSIVIPLPKGASRGDQILNAKHFQKEGLIYSLPQDCLTKNSLLYAINSVYANRFDIINRLNNNPISDASPKIVKIIKSYLK